MTTERKPANGKTSKASVRKRPSKSNTQVRANVAPSPRKARKAAGRKPSNPNRGSSSRRVERTTQPVSASTEVVHANEVVYIYEAVAALLVIIVSWKLGLAVLIGYIVGRLHRG